MKDKRSTQMTIPLEVHPKKTKGYVMQSMRLTFASTKKVSIIAKRIMAKIFEQIVTNDHQFKPYYQIHISEIVSSNDYVDSGKIYQNVQKAFYELTTQAWIFENDGKTKYSIRNLFDSTKEESSTYNDGMITVALNPLLEPYLLELVKQFTVYDLQNYMKLQSWYSVQLYEKLSHFKDTGKWYISIEDYRKQMDCVDKFPNTYDLMKKTLAEPKKELESTPMAFDVVPQKGKQPWERGRAPVTGLEFTLKKRQLSAGEVLNAWDKSPALSEEHRKILDVFSTKWKVSPANIAKYFPLIGIDRLKELSHEWDLKQAGNKRIDNIKSYCNKIITTIGKEILAKKSKSVPDHVTAMVAATEKRNPVTATEPNFSYLDLPKAVGTKARDVVSESDIADWRGSYEEIKDGKIFQGKTFEDFLALQRIFKEGECWVKK